MWPFKKKTKSKSKIVTLTKVTNHVDKDEEQYQIKVNGWHVKGGCVNNLEEAERVYAKYCNPNSNTITEELLKETTVKI